MNARVLWKVLLCNLFYSYFGFVTENKVIKGRRCILEQSLIISCWIWCISCYIFWGFFTRFSSGRLPISKQVLQQIFCSTFFSSYHFETIVLIFSLRFNSNWLISLISGKRAALLYFRVFTATFLYKLYKNCTAMKKG